MTKEFALVRASKTEVVVGCPSEGHLFVFPIRQVAPGKRVVGEGVCRSGSAARRSAEFLHLVARRFAEREARGMDLL